MKNSNYITIKQYLNDMGINPVKDRGYYGLYCSPLREDANPSFKVDYNKNLWYDFGLNEGGSIVDLVMKLEQCSLAKALQRLDDNSFSFHRNVVSSNVPCEQEPAIQIRKVIALSHPALISYLQGRNINIEIAQHYCSEVHYAIAGNPYFAIGFQNNAGGWELRNIGFKGTASPNITTTNNNNDTVMVFEGFVDFLSYLSLKNNPSPIIDTAVLNSTSNTTKAIPFLQSHKTVHAFLDNDDSGRKAVEQLRKALPNSIVIDQSNLYRNHKDLNDYWRTKSHVKQPMRFPVKKKNLGRRM